MAGPITTGTHPQLLWPGLHAIWGNAYREHEQQWGPLFNVEQSDQAYERDHEVTGFGLAPKKPEGSSIHYDTETSGIDVDYVHVAYGLGFIVTYEEMKDNLYRQVASRRSEGLGFSMRQTKENVAANVYNRATNGSYVGGDGVALLSASHPSLAGAQSNIVSSDLTELSLEQITINIKKALNARGMHIALTPRTLAIPVDLQFDAARILESELQNDTANNAVNVLRTMGMFPDIATNVFFSDADAWFVRTDAPRGMTCFVREAVSFDRDRDFDTKNHKYGAYERNSFGWTDWRGLFGSGGV